MSQQDYSHESSGLNRSSYYRVVQDGSYLSSEPATTSSDGSSPPSAHYFTGYLTHQAVNQQFPPEHQSTQRLPQPSASQQQSYPNFQPVNSCRHLSTSQTSSLPGYPQLSMSQTSSLPGYPQLSTSQTSSLPGYHSTPKAPQNNNNSSASSASSCDLSRGSSPFLAGYTSPANPTTPLSFQVPLTVRICQLTTKCLQSNQIAVLTQYHMQAAIVESKRCQSLCSSEDARTINELYDRYHRVLLDQLELDLQSLPTQQEYGSSTRDVDALKQQQCYIPSEAHQVHSMSTTKPQHHSEANPMRVPDKIQQALSAANINVPTQCQSYSTDPGVPVKILQALNHISTASTSSSSSSYAPRRSLTRVTSLARRIMTTWYERNQEHPYPSYASCVDMAEASGLSAEQVKKWFSNKRQRDGNTRNLTDIASTRKRMRDTEEEDALLMHDIKKLRH